jgi:hypothetical protein
MDTLHSKSPWPDTKGFVGDRRPVSVYKYTSPQNGMTGRFECARAWTRCALSHEAASVIPVHGGEAYATYLRTASFSQRSALYRIPGRTFPLAWLLGHHESGMSCLHAHSD